MEAAARALLLVVVVAVLINFAQGGTARVKRWTVRTLTGKDPEPIAAAPESAPAAAAAAAGSAPAAPTTRSPTSNHYIMA